MGKFTLTTYKMWQPLILPCAALFLYLKLIREALKNEKMKWKKLVNLKAYVAVFR